MNNRIRELAQQIMNSDASPHLSEELYCFTKSEFEKFAELIVRKCANIAEYADGNWPADQIKQYFGVEL